MQATAFLCVRDGAPGFFQVYCLVTHAQRMCNDMKNYVLLQHAANQMRLRTASVYGDIFPAVGFLHQRRG